MNSSEVTSTKSSNPKEPKVFIVGKLDDPKVTLLRQIVDDLIKKKNSKVNFEFIMAFEMSFDSYVEDLIKENIEFLNYTQSPIIYIQKEQKKEVIGSLDGFLNYLIENFGHYEERSESMFKDANTKILRNYMKTNGNKYCFLDISIGKQPFERVIFELYYNDCPLTCENFFGLCRGFTNEDGQKVSFKDSIFHRVNKRGYILGGDLSHVKKGSTSIYKGEFPDENYTIKHTVPGCLGMVKKGMRKHSNESQFYITLAPLTAFDGLFVCFGRVIQGFKTVKKIEEVETNLQRPTLKIEIVKCGEYTV